MNNMKDDIEELSKVNSPLSSYWQKGFRRGYEYRQREIEQYGACEKIADHYGIEAQLGILQEECGELIQAASKFRRTSEKKMLIEELADVEIMISQIKYLLGCREKVAAVKIEKLVRQIERIEKEKK